ncbi:MAG TPA: DegT/DnrJ/EryC1/StrS family aminotransferase [Thermoanaerobaculia bacterium]|nr:DegT/DnrJ/EryC1/StrS family aminotransferase [Thermoanaerobaculia bacterium]
MTVVLGKPAFATKINIVRPQLPPYAELQDELAQIITTGMLTKGARLAEFERAAAEHLRVKHAIGVASCTSGLMLAYQALGLTGEAVLPSFTFMATASALVWAGVTPVFADVDFDTTNLDVAAAERAITPKTTAIIATHNFGNPADIEALEHLARKHNLKLVFDAAHGFGALYRGAPVGPQGDVQIYSMTPTKLLVAGEGGVVATNSDELAEKIRMGREYGADGTGGSRFAGLNARLTEINALLALRGLPHVDAAARRRNEYAARYAARLTRIPGIEVQKIDPRDRSSYKDFSIVIDAAKFGMDRDRLAAALAAENIDTRKYYAPAVHEQTPYARFVREDTSLPATERLARGSLSLPLWSEMQDEIIDGICETIERIAEER